MRDTAIEMARRGHSVEVITARHPKGLTEDERDGVLWHYVPHDASRRHRPGRNPRWLAGAANVFISRHNETPFDIVQSESTSARSTTAYCRAHDIPVVIRFHGNYLGLMRATSRRIAAMRSPHGIVREVKAATWATAEFAANWRDLPAFRRCPTVIPSRQQILNTRLSHCVKRDSIEIVPNGVDISHFKPRAQSIARKELGLPPGRPMFVAVGRLSPDKGFDTALKALSMLSEKGGAPMTLAIVGDGPEREALTSLASRLGVAPDVRFAGPQPPENVPRWLNAADAFVFPTHRDEAAPLVLIQAMASELPVIATTSGSIPEVIDRPGENGILVKPSDTMALANAMRLLHDDRDLTRAIAQAGRRRALDRYTVQTMVDSLLEIYVSALRQ